MINKILRQKNGNDGVRFHKDTFEKTTEDRRQRVIDVAIAEFASKGYNATNINEIAKKSGVSIGAMYSYFASKEDLFLTIINKGFELLETVINGIDIHKGDIFSIVETLLRSSRDYAINYPELNQIYIDLTTQGLSSMSGRLSKQMESITAGFYREVLVKAKKEGRISQDINEGLMSFFIDNLVLMFQFSFASDYYKQRMAIFLGGDMLDDTENIIMGMMKFIKKALIYI